MSGEILSSKGYAELESLADELARSGAITEHERMALLNNARNDSARNKAADQTRYRNVPVALAIQPIADEKAIMNPKLIMSAIEKNRAVMEAQIEKFASLPPKRPQPVSTGSMVTVASLLRGAMLGHLQDAAESLQALAEVVPADHDGDEADNNCREPAIIDSVATVIPSGEMK